MTLADLFDLSLIGRRTAPALEFGRTYTFGQIDERASQMAHALANRGVRPGDRVCFYLPNSVDFVALYLAVTRLGAIVVPMNILYRDRELRHIVSDADPVAVIADAHAAAQMPDVAPVWTLEHLRADADAQVATRLERFADGDAPALIVYTSGTTGAPKGAVFTHSSLAVNAATLVTCWQITAADRLHLMLPLFHVHGLCVGLHCWLMSGCLLRLETRFDHQHAARQMLEFAPTVFFGVPTMYVRMLGFDEAAATQIGGKMRLFVSGSAPLPEHVWTEFRKRFGHAILERYGMSETLMIASNPYAGERRPGTVGVPLPGVSVRIADDHGAPVPDGTSGEVSIRSASLFREYWRNPSATAAAFDDGWFRTGDLGTQSADGYITLHGRRTDLIISGGFNIYPREIEDFLSELPGVAEAAVVGVADELRGEVPVAYVVPAAGWDADRTAAACRAHLASFKVPRRFIVVDRLPRTALGKVQKHALGP
ncbi:MAG TPA: AMP-binding protein [Vicinamibacterales bacterium]|nr:AMP-binding protein [Vicinamibacterales bacterium]